MNGDNMTCKNCGAKLRDNAKVCNNCGAFVDDSSGYTLLAADDRVYDVYSNEKPKKKNSGIRLVIAIIIVALIAGVGTYLYFEKIEPSLNKQPSLTFSQGSGLINRNEKVVYVSLPEGSNIQYIHGVSLYDYDRAAVEDLRDAISTDYEYTKNIDSSFRAIFFDMKDFNVDSANERTYTLEMQLSFNGSDKIYTYQDKVTVDGKFENDVSDIVFDHSMTDDGKNNKQTEKSTTKAQNADYSFVYASYWYTAPNTSDNVRSISAFRFNKDKSYTVTNYSKNGGAEWVVETEKGTFKINGDELVLDEGGSFRLDADKEEISEEQDGQTTQTLTSRRYNSLQNTEDFFGL